MESSAIGDGETNALSRIRWLTSNGRLAFNDDDSPAALDFGAYFSAGGAGADLTFTVQTVDGDWQFTVADDRQGGNSSTVRFAGLPTGLVTALDDVTIGDRMIFRAARPTPPEPAEVPVTLGALTFPAFEAPDVAVTVRGPVGVTAAAVTFPAFEPTDVAVTIRGPVAATLAAVTFPAFEPVAAAVSVLGPVTVEVSPVTFPAPSFDRRYSKQG